MNIKTSLKPQKLKYYPTQQKKVALYYTESQRHTIY